jgi:Cys-tRNA(Pro)/Cys-tRNA(Cys) deacylase
MREIQPPDWLYKGRVSPVGTKRPYPVYIDESAFAFDRICVSGGARGVQIFIDPRVLAAEVEALPAPIAKQDLPES